MIQSQFSLVNYSITFYYSPALLFYYTQVIFRFSITWHKSSNIDLKGDHTLEWYNWLQVDTHYNFYII